MKFSWKSLNYLIDLQEVELETLTNLLVLAGFEVENIVEKHNTNDKTFDVDITTNRNDVACVIGLAREISCILKKPLKNKIDQAKIVSTNNHTHLSSTFSKSECISDVIIQEIKHIQPIKSPEWLKNYLISYDIEPDNTIKDIQKYIYIKWGQDIRILNLQGISQKEFDIELISFKIKDKIHFTNNSTNDKSYEIIQYNKEDILANGIHINTKYLYKPSDKSIVVLGSTHNPTYINKNNKQKKLKVNKQRHSISRFDLINAYKETVRLIINLTNGSASTEYKYHNIKSNNTIKLNKNLIHNILGPVNNTNNTYLSSNKIFGILKQLNFEPKYNKNNFIVKIPSYRENDIQRPIDIVEEIGRIHGFDKFIDNLPTIKKIGYISPQTKQIYKIRNTLRNSGLHEIVNYSLQGSRSKEKVAIQNPLLQDQSNLRDNLINNLLDTKHSNLKQGNKHFESFEIGKTFYIDNNKLIEKRRMAAIMGSTNFSRQSWSSPKQELTWFQAKGTIEELFYKIQAEIKWVSTTLIEKDILNKYNFSIYHHKKTALLYNESTKKYIGIFGELNNTLNNQLNNDHKTYLIELDLNSLLKSIQIRKHRMHTIRAYSYYPSVTRDISIKIHSNQNISHIKKIISVGNYELVESIEILNEYIKTTNNRKEKYVSLRITYRSLNRTLNNKDLLNIDDQINHIINL